MLALQAFEQMVTVLTPGNDTTEEADPDKVLQASGGLIKSSGSLLQTVMIKYKETKAKQPEQDDSEQVTSDAEDESQVFGSDFTYLVLLPDTKY